MSKQTIIAAMLILTGCGEPSLPIQGTDTDSVHDGMGGGDTAPDPTTQNPEEEATPEPIAQGGMGGSTLEGPRNNNHYDCGDAYIIEINGGHHVIRDCVRLDGPAKGLDYVYFVDYHYLTPRYPGDPWGTPNLGGASGENP